LSFRGPAFRAHDPRWAWSPLSGEGARVHGGRFNRPGTAALYLALDIETAIHEAKQGFGNRIPPLTIVEYDVEVDSVVDLTTSFGRSACEPWSMQLDCPWKKLAVAGDPVPTWLLSDALITISHNGIIAPGFAPEHRAQPET
jgi:RES domain-containing protein